jgi:hypothetical protein
MPNGIVTKKDFEAIDSVPVKLNILFGTVIDLKENSERRIHALEKRKLRDTANATGAGAVAGFLGALGIKWLIK